VRRELEYSLSVSFYLFIHLFLDMLDGGPVTLLYPFVKRGVILRCGITEPSKSYGTLSRLGVAPAILLLPMVSFDRLQRRIREN
jgi:membrane-bound metal-dependent hydrolase YbcI (DUF457 family)